MDCTCTEVGCSVNDLLPAVPWSVGSDDQMMVLFGSRSFSQFETTKENARAVIHTIDKSGLGRPSVIVSGGADGADAAAEAVSLLLGVPMIVMHVGGPSSGTSHRQSIAQERGIPWVVEECTRYSGGPGPDGKAAYLARNCAMAELVSQYGGSGFGVHVDGSPGTSHMFDSLNAHGVGQFVRWPLSLADA